MLLSQRLLKGLNSINLVVPLLLAVLVELLVKVLSDDANQSAILKKKDRGKSAHEK
jgi:hypothetical protein